VVNGEPYLLAPGDTVKFEFIYKTRNPKIDDDDFGLTNYVMNHITLRVGDQIGDHRIPPHSGKITSFDIKVVDVPEPSTLVLFGIASAFVAGYAARPRCVRLPGRVRSS
jgi:hypothetical protein